MRDIEIETVNKFKYMCEKKRYKNRQTKREDIKI